MKKFPRKRTVAAILLICGSVALGLLALRFIHHRMAYAVTDAVFIRTDSLVNLGFDGVDGRIATMTKNEGEKVSTGETLATIDDRQYQLAVTRLEAELQEARNELAKREITRNRLARETSLNEAIANDEVNRLQEEKAALESKAAAVAAVIAQLGRDRDRYAALVKAKAVASRKVEDVTTELSSRSDEQVALQKQASAVAAALKAARKKVELAGSNRLLVKETIKAIEAQTQKIAALTASLDQARDKLNKCTLKSSTTGRVARRFASPGDLAESGRAIYALVDPKDV
ncbi:MAG: biotin/lipoyl-binding protein, partial [Deltaproteobacteria bacterium]